MRNSFFSRFFFIQNYLHYILNGLLLVGEVYYWKLYGLTTWEMTLLLIGLIFINDSLVHFLFWILPRKYGQWRD